MSPSALETFVVGSSYRLYKCPDLQISAVPGMTFGFLAPWIMGGSQPISAQGRSRDTRSALVHLHHKRRFCLQKVRYCVPFARDWTETLSPPTSETIEARSGVVVTTLVLPDDNDSISSPSASPAHCASLPLSTDPLAEAHRHSARRRSLAGVIPPYAS